MGKIIGPGSMNVDMTGFAPRLPRDGETVMGRELRFSCGGKGANQMLAAHRAGAKALLIGRRGEDSLGELLHSRFAGDNMPQSYILVSKDVRTGCALIEIEEESAQNRIMVIPGANQRVNREAVRQAEKDFADCDVVLTQLEIPFEAVEEAKSMAKKYQKPFVLNPAPFQPMPEEFYQGIDYITPNETETELMTGKAVETLDDAREAAKLVLAKGVRSCIITLGSKGAYYLGEAGECFVPAQKVKAVETTGAGDAFNGGFVCALSEGKRVEEAMKFATCTAALSVTKLGAADSMPSREEIEAQYQKVYGKVYE